MTYAAKRRPTLGALLGGAALVLMAACGDPASLDSVVEGPAYDPETPEFLGTIEGVFDGERFHYRHLSPDGEELTPLLPFESPTAESPLAPSGDVGVARSDLSGLDSFACATCVGSDYIAFSNMPFGGRSITNGASVPGRALWAAGDVTDCGAVPTTGVCQNIRVRNLFSDQVERVYMELIDLAPTGATTSVSIPSGPYTGTADFGLSAPAEANALWRVGTIGRSSPDNRGNTDIWLAFEGSTPAGSTFTFRFRVSVFGLRASATRRANVTTNDDPSANYTAVTTGAAGNDGIDITPNGQFVVFSTDDTTLTGGVAGRHIVRHDFTSGSNTVITAATGGTAAVAGCNAVDPSISDDGNLVTFTNNGCTLDTSFGTPRANRTFIYVRDVTAQTTSLVSRNRTGGFPNGSSLGPRISGDGSVVVFETDARNMVTGSFGNGCREAYLRDLGTDVTRHVSAIDGTTINDRLGFISSCASRPETAGSRLDVSRDGSTVVFRSHQALDTTDSNSDDDIYVYVDSTVTANVYRVSRTSGGAQIGAPTGIDWPAISPDGTTFAFSATASGIVGVSSERQMYRRGIGETDDASLIRVSQTDAGVAGSGNGTDDMIPELSENGRFVAFWSSHSNLIPSTSSNAFRYHVCDPDAAEAELQRCFTPAAIQLTESDVFRVAESGSRNSRQGLACPDENDVCFAAYQYSGSGWGSVNESFTQVFVSPVGDPRAQVSNPSP
ncbi:MAG: hypothetical protein AAGH15_13700 [Myxococcota bacterium]